MQIREPSSEGEPDFLSLSDYEKARWVDDIVKELFSTHPQLIKTHAEQTAPGLPPENIQSIFFQLDPDQKIVPYPGKSFVLVTKGKLGARSISIGSVTEDNSPDLILSTTHEPGKNLVTSAILRAKGTHEIDLDILENKAYGRSGVPEDWGNALLQSTLNFDAINRLISTLTKGNVQSIIYSAMKKISHPFPTQIKNEPSGEFTSEQIGAEIEMGPKIGDDAFEKLKREADEIHTSGLIKDRERLSELFPEQEKPEEPLPPGIPVSYTHLTLPTN